MLTNGMILSALKYQQYSLEDVKKAHEVVLAISNIVANDDATSFKAEIFDSAEELLEALLAPELPHQDYHLEDHLDHPLDGN